jgi:hypothetical protein
MRNYTALTLSLPNYSLLIFIDLCCCQICRRGWTRDLASESVVPIGSTYHGNNNVADQGQEIGSGMRLTQHSPLNHPTSPYVMNITVGTATAFLGWSVPAKRNSYVQRLTWGTADWNSPRAQMSAGHQPYGRTCLVTANNMPGHYTKLNHDHCLPHHVQLLIRCPSYTGGISYWQIRHIYYR